MWSATRLCVKAFNLLLYINDLPLVSKSLLSSFLLVTQIFIMNTRTYLKSKKLLIRN